MRVFVVVVNAMFDVADKSPVTSTRLSISAEIDLLFFSQKNGRH